MDKHSDHQLQHGSLFYVLIGFIFTSIIIFYQITFGDTQLSKWTYIINTNSLSAHWIAGALINYLLRILVDAAIIWCLLGLTRRTLTVADAVHTWLYTFWLGLIFVAIILILQFPFWPKNVLNSFFLISRSAYPVFTGIIIFIFIQPFLQKIAGDRRFSLVIFMLLILNIIFQLDILHLQSGTTINSVVIYGCLALIINKRPHWLRTRSLSVFIVGIITIIGIGWLQARRQSSMLVAFRFVSSMSPLTLIPAIVLVQLLQTHLKNQTNYNFAIVVPRLIIYSSWFMVTGTAYNALWTHTSNFFQKRLAIGPFWAIAQSIALTILIVALVSILYYLISKTKLWQSIDAHWKLDLPHLLNQLITDRQNTFKFLKLTHSYPLVAFCTLFTTQSISCLLMNQSFHMDQLMTHAQDNIFSSLIIGGINKMLGGTVILLAVYWIMLALTNRFWLSLLTTTGASLLFAFASRLKILSRAEPIVPSDLAELGSFREILTLVRPAVIVLIILVIICFIIGIFLLEKKRKAIKQTWYTRLAKFIVSFIFLFDLGFLNHSYSVSKQVLMAFDIYTNSNINMLLYAQQNGPIMAYVSMLDIKIMDKPAGYSKATIQKLVKKYQERAASINKNRHTTAKNLTVLFNLSESFSNPQNIDGVKLNKNPIPYVSALKKQTTSGYMISAGYGGGTANMEYMSLTGMSMGLFASAGVVPNNTIVPKQSTSPNISNLFNYSSAVHPYTGGYYNRQTVYRKYGFNKFVFLGSKYKIIDQSRIGSSPYLSDQTAYANALSQINSRKGGQFINLITMQNHMPYTSDWYPNHDYKVSGKGFSSTQQSQIQHYTQGIAYTDTSLKAFIKSLDSLNKPVIMIFYGDHLPGIYTLPTSIDKYKTDYFVYSNKFARNHGMYAKLDDHQYVSTNEFIPIMLQQANAKVDAYSALLTDVSNKLPALWQLKEAPVSKFESNSQLFIDKSGKLTSYSQLDNKQKRVFNDYQMIQYDITDGKNYSSQLGLTATSD